MKNVWKPQYVQAIHLPSGFKNWPIFQNFTEILLLISSPDLPILAVPGILQIIPVEICNEFFLWMKQLKVEPMSQPESWESLHLLRVWNGASGFPIHLRPQDGCVTLGK